MPTNLYGPGDRFDLESGHVLPALMRKCHEAAVEGRKEIEIWGTGSARREFLHVDDLAEACLFLLEHYDEAGPVNIGSGVEHSILDLATMLRDLIVPGAALVFDRSKPDGTPRKLLDTSRLTELGWSASIPLEIGLETTYRWFVENEAG
jgi:GDP-L-fucose synthase